MGEGMRRAAAAARATRKPQPQKEAPVEREFIVRASIHLRGASVIVKGATEKEARANFQAMKWEERDYSQAETVNYGLQSIEENR